MSSSSRSRPAGFSFAPVPDRTATYRGQAVELKFE